MVKKKWLGQYYSTNWCYMYIHQTCTIELFILTRSTYVSWWFVSLTYISRFSDHGLKEMVRSLLQYLLVPHSQNLHQLFTFTWSTGGLCPWSTFHAWVAMVRKKWLNLYYSTYECYIHQSYTNCSSWHDLLMPCGGLCPWLAFHALETKTQNGNSGAPVMVPITIMSSSSICIQGSKLTFPTCWPTGPV